MSFKVYVLESERDGIWYVGFTEDIVRRLKEHNTGKSKFTSGHLPWKIIYFESIDNRLEARKREKYLKSAAGKQTRTGENNNNGRIPYPALDFLSMGTRTLKLPQGSLELRVEWGGGVFLWLLRGKPY